MTLDDAQLYQEPFEYINQHVKPKYEDSRKQWWIHERPRADLRKSIAHLKRFIATPRVAKHRIFVFMDSTILPDSRISVIARDDDYFFGVLHSRIHEVWSLATSSRHGDGDEGGRPTYNNTTCFETFPFPWSPNAEPTDDPRVLAIAAAARELVQKRENWLNPADATAEELKKRTLTNLYNQRPTWLANAHATLDRAVCAAYGWPADLADDEILARLLALNGERG